MSAPVARAYRVDTLFLDAGGVLMNPNWERMSATLARHGVTVAAQALAHAELRARRRLDSDESVRTSSDEDRSVQYFDSVCVEAGVARSPAVAAALVELRRYHAERNLWESVPEDVVPALTRLRALGLRLVVVSNANGTLHAHLQRLGLSQFFIEMLDSQREGVEKPDPELFRRALARAGAQAATTVHVGDLYHVDVVGARAAGIDAWLLDPANLYADADCPRVATLAELCDRMRGLVAAAGTATA
jgi:HAD superfamily hydrolase (TIGR01549 family)